MPDYSPRHLIFQSDGIEQNSHLFTNALFLLVMPLALWHTKSINADLYMNFIDRTELGTMLAERLTNLHGKNAVILCLQESSLMTCLTMASVLRAWVYPLIYVPVHTPDRAAKVIGAFDQDGEFCPMPIETNSIIPFDEKESDFTDIINKEKPAAEHLIHTQAAAYGMQLDKGIINGRDLVLAADVVTSTLPFVVAQHFLADLSPKSRTAVAGNATPEAAEFLRLSANNTVILDVMSGITFDAGHYFERNDKYKPRQQKAFTRHIAEYWQ